VQIDGLCIVDLEDDFLADAAGEGAEEVFVHFCQILGAFDEEFLLGFAVGAENRAGAAGEEGDDADHQAFFHDELVLLLKGNFLEA
jgi:hypothetical protein